MENASKALIIAGAILVSIMIIGLGVVILNNVRSTITNQNLHSEEAQANNEKFTSMFGQNLSASEVKNLINLIRSNNIVAESDRDGLGKIFIKMKVSSAQGVYKSTTDASKLIKNGKRYEVNTLNDTMISEKAFLEGNSSTGGKDDTGKDLPSSETPKDEKEAAFYYNGFIRIIEIVEITKDEKTT